MISENNDSLFTEASLADSVIYKLFNNNAEMSKIITSGLKDSVVLDSSYIEEQLMQIKRTRISPLADIVLEAYERGEIVLLFSKVKKIPQALPFFTAKVQGQVKSFIFVNNYGTISKSPINSEQKYLNITMKDLYVLMEGAYVSYKYAVYPAKMKKSLGLMRLCSGIYTSMILRVLNKEYAISMDQDLYSKVSFCVSKFFLKNIWNSDNNEINFSYSIGNIRNDVNKADMLLLSELFDSKNITNIEELILFIKELSPRLNAINLRYFLQWYINTYKGGAMFSLECLPYFLFTVEASMIGSFIVNQPIISDITKTIKGMNTFYPELFKTVS